VVVAYTTGMLKRARECFFRRSQSLKLSCLILFYFSIFPSESTDSPNILCRVCFLEWLLRLVLVRSFDVYSIARAHFTQPGG
jgi:hypothetical protein